MARTVAGRNVQVAIPGTVQNRKSWYSADIHPKFMLLLVQPLLPLSLLLLLLLLLL
jgi:hypothetical protein